MCSINKKLYLFVTNHTYTALALESSVTLSSLATNSRSRGTSGWPDSEMHCFKLFKLQKFFFFFNNIFQLLGVIEHLRSAPMQCIDTCWTPGILGSVHWSAGSRGSAAGAARSHRPARWTPPPGSSPSAARGPHGPPASLSKLQIVHLKARERKWVGLSCTNIEYTTVERLGG